jgi:hypothetical protein
LFPDIFGNGSIEEIVVVTQQRPVWFRMLSSAAIWLKFLQISNRDGPWKAVGVVLVTGHVPDQDAHYSNRDRARALDESVNCMNYAKCTTPVSSVTMLALKLSLFFTAACR